MPSTDSYSSYYNIRILVYITGFMPGFLDELNRDEKILVLFAISFMLVFTGAAIGGIVCILSGSDNFYHKYWKRRRHDYQTEFADR